MKKRFIIPLALLFSILAFGFIMLGSHSAGTSKYPCKESMEQCCKKKSRGSSEGPIWETLSRQFFSFAGHVN